MKYLYFNLGQIVLAKVCLATETKINIEQAFTQ